MFLFLFDVLLILSTTRNPISVSDIDSVGCWSNASNLKTIQLFTYIQETSMLLTKFQSDYLYSMIRKNVGHYNLGQSMYKPILMHGILHVGYTNAWWLVQFGNWQVIPSVCRKRVLVFCTTPPYRHCSFKKCCSECNRLYRTNCDNLH